PWRNRNTGIAMHRRGHARRGRSARPAEGPRAAEGSPADAAGDTAALRGFRRAAPPTQRSSPYCSERIGQLGVGRQLCGLAEVDAPLTGLAHDSEEMAWKPIGLRDDALVPEEIGRASCRERG